MTEPCSVSYDPYGVMLSFIVALVNAFTAVQYSEQWRYARRKGNTPLARRLLRLMSIAVGGGIWSMHFTGMSAMEIRNGDGEVVPVRYHSWLTVVSFFSALVCTHLGALVASKDKYFHALNHTAKLMEDLQRKSLMQLQDRKTIFSMALLSSLHHLALGGCLTGAGVLVMHYLGMLAQDMNATIEWDVSLVLLSIFIACFAATAAFWLIFRLLVFKRQYETPRFLSAFTMATAVCGMHYTGMAAGKLSFSVKAEHMNHTMGPDPLTWFAQLWTLGTAMLGFSLVTHDLRRLRVAASDNSGNSVASVVTNASQATHSAISRSKSKRTSGQTNLSVEQRLKNQKNHSVRAVAPTWDVGGEAAALLGTSQPSSQHSSFPPNGSNRSSCEVWPSSAENSTLFVSDSLSQTADRHHSKRQQEEAAAKAPLGPVCSADEDEDEMKLQDL